MRSAAALAILLVASSASSEVLCKCRSGAVVVRSPDCKVLNAVDEVRLDSVALGLPGPQGPQGPPGTAGPVQMSLGVQTVVIQRSPAGELMDMAVLRRFTSPNSERLARSGG